MLMHVLFNKLQYCLEDITPKVYLFTPNGHMNFITPKIQFQKKIVW